MTNRKTRFATCDTCGGHTICFYLGNDEDICEMCDSAPRIEAERIKAQQRLDNLVRLLKIVVGDPFRAWQVCEEIDLAVKEIEQLQAGKSTNG